MKNMLTIAIVVVAVTGVILMTSAGDKELPAITVESPQRGNAVSSPFMVTGQARTFEQNVVYRLVDDSGEEIAHGFTTAHAEDIGLFGPYDFAVEFETAANRGTLEVFESSAKDGSEIHKVRVPLKFK